MFDDFRNAISDEQNDDGASNTTREAFTFPEEGEFPVEPTEEQPRRSLPRIKVPREVMGMTPVQNFVISMLLFFTVVISGLFFLIITGKMMIF